MKSKRYKVLFWLLTLLCLESAAREVDVNRARNYALEFITSVGDANYSVRETKCVSKDGNALYYIVNMNPCGWVLVSAQDGVNPLLGYNLEDSYVDDPGLTNQAQWMDYYTTQIMDAIKDNDPALPVWDYPSRPVTRASTTIEPLIQVNWNQGRPYNQFCPSDDDGRAVVGCVAVGMAQAMSVAKWPNKPNGSYTYQHNKYGVISIDYDTEDPYDWDKIISGADNKIWVAHLLYHCGVAVAMDYGVDGSGSFTSRVAKALPRNFGYSSNTIQFYSRDSFSDDAWTKLLLDELQAGRAIIYSGTDSKGGYGHCFNLDGYDGALFHVNWGWGGSNNGYFPVSGLRDVHMNMDYDINHAVVIGVKEPSAAPLDITLSTTELQAGLPAGTVLSKVNVKSDVEGFYQFKITGPLNMITHKYNTVPFKININQELVSTQSLVDGAEYNVIITASTMEGESLKKEFVLTVKQQTGVSEIIREEPYSQEFYSLSGIKLELREEDLQPGIYIRVQTMPDGSRKKSKTVIR